MSETVGNLRSSMEREKSLESNNNVDSLFEGDSSKDFQMRPKLGEKFHQATVQEVIESVLREFLQGKQYVAEEAPNWVNEIAKLINSRVRQLNYPRYKLVSSVVLGEQIGGGIHIGMRCLWDADTDLYATFTYMTFFVGLGIGIVAIISIYLYRAFLHGQQFQKTGTGSASRLLKVTKML